ncbi:histidine kinase [Terrabacter sp. 28]|nr:histidine kinase [Terrabacter sp. 28]
MNTDRPLDAIRSIKVKLGLLVAVSIVAAILVSEIGDRAEVPIWLTVPVTVVAALGVTQWLARGMTSPLREMTAAASRMATGDYSQRVTATATDEVGTLSAAFNTMAADLADADRQRRQLVATVSHELRTPLTAQQALLENLVDGVVRPDDAVLRTALAQAERLGALVGDLLDLSRVDGGRVPLVLATLDVRELVETAVAEAGVSRRGTVHVVEVPEGLTVTGDAARLHQVLANLLDNADRHSPTGGTVTVSAGPEGDDRWWLLVSDEGAGIAPEHAERVFDRFGSGDDAGGGTGIGLAIASWVCELHGGSIAALPTPSGERGARIRAVLPRTPRPATIPTTYAAPSPDGPSATTSAPTSAAAGIPTDIPTDSPAESPAESPAGSPADTTPTSSKESVVPVPTPATAGSSPPVPPGGRAAAGGPTAYGSVPVGAPKPLLDSIFGDLWPETGVGPQVRLLLTCVGVGVLAAVVLPYRDMGVALFLVLTVGGVVLWRTSQERRRPWTVATSAVCVGLASLAVLRSTEWLLVLAVLLGILLVTTALTGARGLLSMVAGAASWPLAALRGLPLLGRSISATSRVGIVWPIVRTAAISLVALVVFGGLFASGDAIFGSWASALVPQLAWDSLTFRFFVGFVMGGALLAAAYVALNPPRVQRVALPAGRPVARTFEWVVPVGLVVALFVAFVVAQAAALFGGHDYVQRTTGLTYADYVHQGFGQLTFATVLTLLTIAIAARKAPRATARDRLVLRVVLGTLCALTLVVVGSALHRMDLYQQAYGFTVLRVLVDAFELWLGLLVVLVTVAGIRLRGWWLPRAALMSAAVFVLVGGILNPEAWVARHNIDRYAATGKIDAAYLRTLGPDATPTIVAGLPRNLSACIVLPSTIEARAAREDLLSWNLGRSREVSVAPAPLTQSEAAACPALMGAVPTP